MERNLIYNGIAVRKSPIHGYGVFAEKAFKKDEIIEECYIFFAEGNDPKLQNYYYELEDHQIFIGGQGAVYNHADQPNVDYYIDLETKLAIFKAHKPIEAGEELLISYGESWFSERNMSAKQIPRWKKWIYLKYSLVMRAGVVGAVIMLITKLLARPVV